MKTFYSAQEIEDLARQGVRELMVDDNVVLTDLARQIAGQVGIRLVAAAGSAGSARPVAASAQPATRPATENGARGAAVPTSAPAPLPAKPRGCQHSAAVAGPAGSVAGASGSGHMVDDLVGLVKQMSKR